MIEDTGEYRMPDTVDTPCWGITDTRDWAAFLGLPSQHSVTVDQRDFMRAAAMTFGRTRENAEFWMSLIEEERSELSWAVVGGCLESILHEAIDLMYVTCGLLNALQLPASEAWERIHAANMAKVASPIRRREDGKILKPDGWKPADLSDLVSGKLQ